MLAWPCQRGSGGCSEQHGSLQLVPPASTNLDSGTGPSSHSAAPRPMIWSKVSNKWIHNKPAFPLPSPCQHLQPSLKKGYLLPTFKSWLCPLPATHFSWLQGLGLLPGAACLPLVRLRNDHQLWGEKCTKQNEKKKKKKKGKHLQSGRLEECKRQQAEQRPKSVQKTGTL